MSIASRTDFFGDASWWITGLHSTHAGRFSTQFSPHIYSLHMPHQDIAAKTKNHPPNKTAKTASEVGVSPGSLSSAPSPEGLSGIIGDARESSVKLETPGKSVKQKMLENIQLHADSWRAYTYPCALYCFIQTKNYETIIYFKVFQSSCNHKLSM